MVKARVINGAQEQLSDAFDRLLQAHLARVNRESTAALENRAAALLPALALARVDGKSPLEYLAKPHRAALRAAARPAIAEGPTTLPRARRCLLKGSEGARR